MTVHKGGAVRATVRIASSDIVSVAMRLVGSAQHTIEATMDISEEIKRPLPGSYFGLLKSKMDEGVMVVRVGFGSQKDFLYVQAKMPIHAQYVCKHFLDIKKYKRMLLIDSSFLLYALETKMGRRYYYTVNPCKIAEYRHYFQQICG